MKIQLRAKVRGTISNNAADIFRYPGVARVSGSAETRRLVRPERERLFAFLLLHRKKKNRSGVSGRGSSVRESKTRHNFSAISPGRVSRVLGTFVYAENYGGTFSSFVEFNFSIYSFRESITRGSRVFALGKYPVGGTENAALTLAGPGD